MKVFLDARMVRNSGVGRYVQNIIEKGCREHVELLALLNKGDEHFIDGASKTQLLYTRYPSPIYSLREQFEVLSQIRKHKPDLVHFPNFNYAFGCQVPFTVTIHDLIYLKSPGACSNVLAKYYAGFMIKSVCNKARLVITDSQFSKKDILETVGISPDKIRVIYPGVDQKYRPVENARQRLASYSLPEKYILYVGNQEKRKNLPALIAAFASSLTSRDHSLVIVGHRDFRRHEIQNALAAYQVDNKVHFTGYIQEKDLPAVYSAAALFVFPSSYEGFGLPVLEAMACGVPVICSSTTSLPEVAGDAAITIDPGNEKEFAKAIDKVIGDKEIQRTLKAKGFQRSKIFSWEKSMQELIAVYKEAAEKGDPHVL